MTVIEVVKAYHLEDIDKRYFNLYGDCVDLSFSLDELMYKEVKDFYLNLRTKHVNITLLTFER